MNAKELSRKIKSKEKPCILDVRSGFEFTNGHIPGAIHAPSMKILFKMVRLPEDKNTELVVTCEHGPRAQIAQGILGMYGYRNVTLLDGHMAGWRHAGLSIEK
ncbi:MAG: rhodanese-like domain-containing protein [Desulfuromonadaceae bacterium]|nr:rhodanese-like domain-containing protein [Desulfuromonadaceae bacterium]